MASSAVTRFTPSRRNATHVTLSCVIPVPSSRLAVRLAWIDWMRGLACILMFQTHCYDAWLGGAARNTSFLQGSRLLGTLPAPMFLFLAGVSFALIADKLIRKNLTPAEICWKMARRGAEILAFGFLFRLQEFLIAWGWAPWSDLFRVDILNIIGLSMILMALTCGIALVVAERLGISTLSGDSNGSASRRFGSAMATVSIAIAALIALLTPPLYTTWRPTWLPWELESYIDGCHNLGAPQPWIFPFFLGALSLSPAWALGFCSSMKLYSREKFLRIQFATTRRRLSPFSAVSESQQSWRHAGLTILLSIFIRLTI